MRKKKPAEHVNHERWLVSYADFITLLFAFFVVMFAVSQVDSSRVGRFSQAFSQAVGVSVMPLQGVGLVDNSSGIAPSTEGAAHDGPLPAELEALRREAQHSPDMQGLQVLRRRNELVLRLPDGVVFDSGNAQVRAEADHILRAIGASVRDRTVDVRVEGHTDDRPIRTARFASNWELSTARATAVLLVLASCGIAPTRLAAAGYGEFRPIAPNTTDPGRAQNRRVDLVVAAAAPPSADHDSDQDGTTDGAPTVVRQATDTARDAGRDANAADAR